MIITTLVDTHECVSAEQHLDGVRLLDEYKNIMVIIANPATILSIEGGEITIIEEANEPSQIDRIEAQVTYTAMMTDTLLEV